MTMTTAVRNSIVVAGMRPKSAPEKSKRHHHRHHRSQFARGVASEQFSACARLACVRRRRRRRATNSARAMLEKTPVESASSKEDVEREGKKEEEEEKKRRATSGTSSSSSSSSSSKTPPPPTTTSTTTTSTTTTNNNNNNNNNTSDGKSFSSISSPASAFVSFVRSSVQGKKETTKKTKTDWEISLSSSSSSSSGKKKKKFSKGKNDGPLIDWEDAVEVTINDDDEEEEEEEEEDENAKEKYANGGDVNTNVANRVVNGKGENDDGERILSRHQQTMTEKTKAANYTIAGNKSKKTSGKDRSSSSLKKEENKSLSAYPYQSVAEQSVEARREQLLNAIDWGVVENGEEALRIFDEQVAKSQAQEKSQIEIFFDETPNARILLKFVVFPVAFSQTMNYSFIEPYFNAEFASKGENVAAEMLPMNLRQDILQRVERNERMREYEIQMGRAPQLTETQKNQARIKDARAIEEKTLEERKKELSNRWTDVAFISAFFMSFFGRRSAANDWIDQTRNWFFDLGPANQAFILLLTSDVLVGYHSADGWNTVLESLGDKYGIADNHAAISIFTALVPVGMDVLFKFWVFKYLRKLAPSTQIILEDIDRH